MFEYRNLDKYTNFSEIGNQEKNIINLKNSLNLDIEFFDYAKKFNQSANILANFLLNESNIRTLDYYFFSTTFLYRHSIELILKAIGFKYIKNIEDRKKFIESTFHNLSAILIYVKLYIQTEINQNYDAYLWLDELLKNINDIDKASDSFRYPFSIKKEKNDDIFLNMENKNYDIYPLFIKQTHINFKNLVYKMNIAFEIIECYFNKNNKVSNQFKNYNPIFLETGGSYYHQSVVGYSYNINDFYPYVVAYIESANYLYSYFLQNTNSKEIIFMPMCYLYRNGIELLLKQFIFEESSLNFQTKLKKMKNKKHSIKGLWNVIEPDILKNINNIDKNINKYIDELHNLDIEASKFRYPADKNLKFYFENEKKLDMENVFNFFLELYSFLDGINSSISQKNKIQREIDAENYYQNFENMDY